MKGLRQTYTMKNSLESQIAAVERENEMTQMLEQQLAGLKIDTSLLEKQTNGLSEMRKQLEDDEKIWGISTFVSQYHELKKKSG